MTHTHGSSAKRSQQHATTRERKDMTSRLRLLTDLGRNQRLDKEPWPALGALAAGAGGMALAATVGVGELAIGAAAAYAAFRFLRHGVAPWERERRSA